VADLLSLELVGEDSPTVGLPSDFRHFVSVDA